MKVIYVTKAYWYEMCLRKREVIPHLCLLCKKYTRKHFFQLKTIDVTVRRIPLMLKLTSTYYAFGCKKYICKKCHLKNLIREHCWNMRDMPKKIFVDFSMLLEGEARRYWLDSFYYCNKCLAYKNVSINEKRFDIKQKYIPRPIILSNQPTHFLGHKRIINQVLNLCGGVEICYKVSDLIEKVKWAKCNNYTSLGNDDHISTHVVHNNNGSWKVVCNFCSNVYPFEGGHKISWIRLHIK